MSRSRQDTGTVIRRSLAILRRMQRGPATKSDLIQAVLAAEGPDAYGGASGRALERRFEADKERLHDVLGARWDYRRSSGTYHLLDVWEPLLDLPDDALAAIPFLQETFEPDQPMHDPVQNLLSLVAGQLSPERLGDLERQRTALQVQWGQRDDDHIPADVELTLDRALLERRLVAFDYHSPAHSDGLPRRHVVEPWERRLDSVRGHQYLRGYCRRVSGPDGEAHYHRWISYRLGRMRNLELLPQKLPPTPPSAPRFELVYRLAPRVARGGNATRQPHIDMLRTEPQADGGLVVHAETDSVWWAVRALLHYGSTCQVLGGPEVLHEMRRTVEEMARVYELIEDEE